MQVDVSGVIEAATEQELQKLRDQAKAERENSLAEEVDGEVFSSYECRSLRGLGNAHPGDISEPGLLAAVDLPPTTYGPEALEGEIVDKTRLSRLQLEGVLYAAQRHTHLLPDGNRAGFFIGDGAGVGKGRQIAGIILDSWARGRRKHVWFSISNDLKLDAERDLKDIDCHISVIDGCQGLDSASSKGLGMSKSSRHGCLFSTYSTLASSRSSATGKKSRLEQLVDWCGGSDFSGCLVFDEAHKAKNFNSVKEELSTKISQAVIKIQEMLPKARVVYCSATGVTDLGNLAYATRLGLWGPDCPFNSFKNFKASMEKRGLGALEMLAMELKANGSYVSRGLGWKGAEFDTTEVELPARSVLMYDKAVDFWMLLRRELEKAAQMCGNSGICKADKCAKGHVCSPMRQFWGQQQRFFRELTSAAKVEFVVALAKEALCSGMSVVVGLQSTGESGLDKAMEEMNKRPGDAVDKLISSAYYGIVGFIKLFFPTRTVVAEVHVLSDQEIEENIRHQLEIHIRAGNTELFDVERARAELLRKQAISKLQAAEQSVSKDVPECIEAKNRLLALAKKLDLLPSPLDALIDAFGGTDEVAEMTGRRGRLVRCTRSGGLKYELRPENEETSLNIRERELFMSAKKRVAIISDAASTGVSLHAAVGTLSAGYRRLHITLELPWSADKAIQQLGRSHRSNQASAPVFRLLVTNLGGERRFASAVAKRLASLGALTRGDRRAATGADFSSFDLDTKYGRRALRLMLTAIASKTGLAPGVGMSRLGPYVQPWQTCLSRTTVAETMVHMEVTGVDAGGQMEELASEAKEELLVAVTQVAEESLEEMGIESNQYNNVALFLGRIQGLPVRRQNLMFAYLIGALEAVVAEARAAGLYDQGVADLRASSVTLKGPPEDVARDPATGAVTTLMQVVLDRGVSWEQALAKRGEASEAGMDEADENLKSGATITAGITPKPKGTGFYRSRHTDITTQKKLVLLAVRKAKHNKLMVITRPNTGTSPYELDLAELREKYYRVPDEDGAIAQVQHSWTQAFDLSDGADYRGSRKVTLGLLSGSVLPVWSALEKTVVACRADMTTAEQALKVYRVILDDGRKLVGVRVPIAGLSILRQHLVEAAKARKIVVEGGGGGTVEPADALDPQVLLRVKTPPKNIHSYFSPAARISGAPSSLPSMEVKRAAVCLTPGSSGRGSKKRGKIVGSGNGEKEKEKHRRVTKGMTNLFGARLTSVTRGAAAGGESGHTGTAAEACWTTGAGGDTDIIVVDD